MIYSIQNNQKKEFPWLFEAVIDCGENQLKEILEHRKTVISIVGGGGKTTCIKALAAECYKKSIHAAITTTTHMQMPHDEFMLEQEDIDQFDRTIAEHGQIWLGKRLKPGDPGTGRNMIRNKSRSLSVGFIREICRVRSTPVFIEADGARCLPCKAPAGHEPVIIPETTDVLSVYGMDSLDRTFAETVFRYELACSLLSRQPEDVVTEEDIVRLAASEEGGKKAVADGMKYIVVLNKADTDRTRERAFKIADMLTERGIERVLVTNNLKELML